MVRPAAAYKSTRKPASKSAGEAASREMRAQGRKTMAKLLDAGLAVFAERGYQAARVDDVVRKARTSHGTFYLYFSSKEDLLRALAVECAREWEELAEAVGAVDADAAGREELRRFVHGFVSVYRRYGPVIRAWMEDQVEDREVNRLGIDAFMRIATVLGRRMRDAGAPSGQPQIGALMALLERFTYFAVSRSGIDDAAATETLTMIVHRGFFGAPPP